MMMESDGKVACCYRCCYDVVPCISDIGYSIDNHVPGVLCVNTRNIDHSGEELVFETRFV